MSLDINVVETCTDITECITAEEIRHTTQLDGHLNALKEYVINGCPSTKIKEEIQLYWPFRDHMAMIDGIVMKTDALLYQLHYNKEPLSNYM